MAAPGERPQRSGFVGLIGRPNVGKSTLLNHYLAEKVAIVSSKPQTTRRRLLGVLTRAGVQVIFVDTPGFHQPEHALGRFMVEEAKAAMEDVDVLVMIIDARQGLTDADQRVFAHLRRLEQGERKRPVLLALNKVDLVKKPRLLPLIEACAATGLFEACIPVSALTGEQMDRLLREIVTRLPQGPTWYPPEQITDQTALQRAAELIREQVLAATHEEVPHAVAVLVDELREGPRVVSIRATIFVERPGQKAIVIGRGGAMLKRIGQEARRELERLLGRKVYLGLWVKVAAGWRSDASLLRQLGYAAASP